MADIPDFSEELKGDLKLRQNSTLLETARQVFSQRLSELKAKLATADDAFIPSIKAEIARIEKSLDELENPDSEETERLRKKLKSATYDRPKKATQNVEKKISSTKSQLNIPGIGKKKSAQDQIAEIQLKRLKQEMKPRIQPKFALPKIATERSTEIVIGCIIAIFLIEIGAGTKFTALWNYAFSNIGTDVLINPTLEITSNKPGTNLAPLHSNNSTINPLNSTGFGASYANSWGYSDLLDSIHLHGIHS